MFRGTNEAEHKKKRTFVVYLFAHFGNDDFKLNSNQCRQWVECCEAVDLTNTKASSVFAGKKTRWSYDSRISQLPTFKRRHLSKTIYSYTKGAGLIRHAYLLPCSTDYTRSIVYTCVLYMRSLLDLHRYPIDQVAADASGCSIFMHPQKPQSKYILSEKCGRSTILNFNLIGNI